MPTFDCRFPDFDGDEPCWERLECPFDDFADAAVEFCEANFNSSLFEVNPPYRVEVRDQCGNIELFTVDVEMALRFWAYREGDRDE